MTTTIFTNELTNNDLSPTPVSITSGVDPVDLDPSIPYYAVTTGGTGDVEILDLPNPTLGAGGTNPGMVGLRIRLVLAEQTDPGDVVKITCGGSANIDVISNMTFGAQNIRVFTLDGEQLNFVGAMAVLEWAGDHWVTNPYLCDGESDTEYTLSSFTIDSAGQIKFTVGSTGDFEIVGLHTDDPGNPNAFWLENGLFVKSGASLASATISYLATLPTSDPAVAGEPWLDGGVFTVSAG